jgi:hypothetical protein
MEPRQATLATGEDDDPIDSGNQGVRGKTCRANRWAKQAKTGAASDEAGTNTQEPAPADQLWVRVCTSTRARSTSLARSSSSSRIGSVMPCLRSDALQRANHPVPDHDLIAGLVDAWAARTTSVTHDSSASGAAST